MNKFRWAAIGVTGIAIGVALWANFSTDNPVVRSTTARPAAPSPIASDRMPRQPAAGFNAMTLPIAVQLPQATLAPAAADAIVAPSRIALPALEKSLLDRLLAEDRRSDGKSGEPVREGVVRTVPASSRSLDVASLAWHPAADGGSVAHFDVSSENAYAMRVNLDVMPNDQSLLLRYVDGKGNATASVAWAQLASHELGSWSPLLDGDRIRVEVLSPAGVPVKPVQLAVTQVTHVYRAGPTESDTTHAQARLGTDLVSGAAGQCSYNAMCVNNGTPGDAYSKAANAVARISFISGQYSYLCSGSLVGKSSTDRYFLTAAHCVSDAAAASTLSTRWFYQKVGCGITNDSRIANLPGGAELVSTDKSKDLTLLRLKTNSPASIEALPLQSGALVAGTGFMGIHHPGGDLKKVSEGMVSTLGLVQFTGISGLIKTYQVSWKAGITAPGSSGSPMLAWDGSKFVVSGALTGGNSSCTRLTGTDSYSVLADFYPQIAAYVGASSTPSTSPATAPAAPGPGAGIYTLNTGDGKSVVLPPFSFVGALPGTFPLVLNSSALPAAYAPYLATRVEPVATPAGGVKLGIAGLRIVAPNALGKSAYGAPMASGGTDPASALLLEAAGKLANGKNAYRIRMPSPANTCFGKQPIAVSNGQTIRPFVLSDLLIAVACSSASVLQVSLDPGP